MIGETLLLTVDLGVDFAASTKNKLIEHKSLNWTCLMLTHQILLHFEELETLT